MKDVVRKMGITEQTFYRWKKKYGGMEDAEEKTQEWKIDCNEVRLHGSLGNHAPKDVAQQWAQTTGPMKPDS